MEREWQWGLVKTKLKQPACMTLLLDIILASLPVLTSLICRRFFLNPNNLMARSTRAFGLGGAYVLTLIGMELDNPAFHRAILTGKVTP